MRVTVNHLCLDLEAAVIEVERARRDELLGENIWKQISSGDWSGLGPTVANQQICTHYHACKAISCAL